MGTDIEKAVLAQEQAVLDRWAHGDPYGFVENGLAEMTWFDHTTQARLDGRDLVAGHIAQYEGLLDVPRHDLPNATVRVFDDTAVLTANWVTYGDSGEVTSQWNATEIYRREGESWKYAHCHWSPIAVEA